MCGIYGYIGNTTINNFVDKLSLLEYRGYDSCGIAYNYNNHIILIRTKGNTNNLKRIINNNTIQIGIGHTRWATHGKISPINAHPHTSRNNRFYCVHNGVIENYQELKDKYNIQTISESDSAIIPVILDFLINKYSIIDSLKILIKEFVGTYAIAIIDRYNPEALYFIKNKSPLLISKSDNNISISSDQISFNDGEKIIVLNDLDYGSISKKEIIINNYLSDNERVTFIKNESQLCKRNEAYYMLDEIYFEKKLPSIISEKYKRIHLDEYKMTITTSKELVFIGSGSSYYAASILAYEYEKKLNKRCFSLIASEVKNFNISNNSMFITLSQSGETMDLCDAIDYLKSKNQRIISICNIVHSTIGFKSDCVYPLSVGREISVASTKAFMAMLYVGRGLLDNSYFDNSIYISHSIKNALLLEPKIIDISKRISSSNFIFYVGSGIDYLYSLEASLKLREISYLHSLSIQTGELKHGSLALVDFNTYCIGILSSLDSKARLESSLSEVSSRGGKTIIISNVYNKADLFYEGDSLGLIVIIQLIAFHTARLLNRTIDQPRNLAKSVTVK